MGISIGGVASPPITGFDAKVLGELLQCKLQPIDTRHVGSLNPGFDTRNEGDVNVGYGPRHLCISNKDVSDELLFDGNRQFYDRFLSVTGMRGRVVFFCLYDSGDSYGFSVFEDGQAIRHRLYSLGYPELRRVVHGNPLAIEQPWHPAILTNKERQDFDPEEHDELFRHEESQQLLNEHSLSSYLVDEVLKAEFGWSPLNDAIEGQSYRALREAQIEASRPWWRATFH